MKNKKTKKEIMNKKGGGIIKETAAEGARSLEQSSVMPFKIEKHWQSTSAPKDRIVPREFEGSSGNDVVDVSAQAWHRTTHEFFV
jgi:hypothetical protein